MDLNSGREREQPVHNLLNGLGRNLSATLIAVGFADPGKEKPKIIVDLCDRPYGGARVLSGTLLLN